MKRAERRIERRVEWITLGLLCFGVAAKAISWWSESAPRLPASDNHWVMPKPDFLEVAPVCDRAAGSLPDPKRPAGKPDSSIPIEHFIIATQENHSFDSYFGRLSDSRYYGKEVDGISKEYFNQDKQGKDVFAYHETSRCTADPAHDWQAMLYYWNAGKNDRFAMHNSKQVMAYYEDTDLPYYYALANEFAISDRFFAPVLSQTFPNRFFLMAGTAFGHLYNDTPQDQNQFAQKTIFDVLDQFGVTWAFYGNPTESYLKLFLPLYRRSKGKVRTLEDYNRDLKNSTLPSVVFLESRNWEEDEHPVAEVGAGEAWIKARLDSLMASSLWRTSAFLLTYDENGGFFDHVSPPLACAPGDVKTESSAQRDLFSRYGFRTPFVAASPFARRHFVSHQVNDLTSVLKLIETKFNLPALTQRDANANNLLELFDFSHAHTEVPHFPDSKFRAGKKCE